MDIMILSLHLIRGLDRRVKTCYQFNHLPSLAQKLLRSINEKCVLKPAPALVDMDLVIISQHIHLVLATTPINYIATAGLWR